MAVCVLVVQGLLELFGVGGFVLGYFLNIWWLVMAGGLVMVLDDIYQIQIGILNPMFPVIFTIVLAMIIDPWYVGIFWSLACFKFLDTPGACLKIFAPRKVAERVLNQQERGGF